MRKYGGLYSQTRLETLDNLDKLPQLVSAEELKNKLLFSVMVVSSQPYSKLLRLSLSLDYDKICKYKKSTGGVFVGDFNRG